MRLQLTSRAIVLISSLALAVCVLSLSWAGCRETRFDVTGDVSLGGEPLPLVFVTFYDRSNRPVEAAKTDPDGRFELSPGLAEGSYKVAVFDEASLWGETSDGSPELAQGASRALGIPERYQSPQTSDFQVEVTADGENRFPFSLDDQ